jgi:quercetin dioxygenase-like cupin family protein
MKFSRRDWSLALAALAAAPQAKADGAALPSKCYRYEDLPVKEHGPNRQRAVLKGETHSSFAIEMHETELAPGEAPHPPHHHVHEEVIVIREGTMEVTILDRSTQLGPGSVAYIASGDQHGWRNVGSTRARYMVLALGRDS